MQTVTRYISFDGKEWLSSAECMEYETLLNGKVHRCPKCDGKGTVGEAIYGKVRDYDQEGYMGWGSVCWKKEIVRYDSVRCDVCGGMGYTSREIKPLLETKIEWVS